MKVLKFGGTSVGSVQSISCLKNIVENEAGKQPVIVVVSALGGITDQLLATAKMAQQGDDSYMAQLIILPFWISVSQIFNSICIKIFYFLN